MTIVDSFLNLALTPTHTPTHPPTHMPTQPTSQYLYRVNMLVASYASVVGLHYLVGFILIIIIYWKILKRIKLIRNNRGEYNTYDPYIQQLY